MKKALLIIAIVAVLGVGGYFLFTSTQEQVVSKVSFNTSGGTEILEQIVGEDGTLLRPADPTKEGYVFKGWLLNGQPYDFTTPLPEGDIELIADWEEEIVEVSKKYTVQFKSDNVVISTITVQEGDIATKPVVGEKEGYEFVEWQKNGQKFEFTTAITEDMELVAKWEKVEEEEEVVEQVTKPSTSTKTSTSTTTNSSTSTKPSTQVTQKYTVKFDTSGGTGVSSQTVESGKKATKPSEPTKKDYKFLGWYLDGKTFDFSTAIKKNITLTAKWKYNKTVSEEKINELIRPFSIFACKGPGGEKMHSYFYRKDKYSAENISNEVIMSIALTELYYDACKNPKEYEEYYGDPIFTEKDVKGKIKEIFGTKVEYKKEETVSLDGFMGYEYNEELEGYACIASGGGYAFFIPGLRYKLDSYEVTEEGIKVKVKFLFAEADTTNVEYEDQADTINIYANYEEYINRGKTIAKIKNSDLKDKTIFELEDDEMFEYIDNDLLNIYEYTFKLDKDENYYFESIVAKWDCTKIVANKLIMPFAIFPYDGLGGEKMDSYFYRKDKYSAENIPNEVIMSIALTELYYDACNWPEKLYEEYYGDPVFTEKDVKGKIKEIFGTKVEYKKEETVLVDGFMDYEYNEELEGYACIASGGGYAFFTPGLRYKLDSYEVTEEGIKVKVKFLFAEADTTNVEYEDQADTINIYANYEEYINKGKTIAKIKNSDLKDKTIFELESDEMFEYIDNDLLNKYEYTFKLDKNGNYYFDSAKLIKAK